ncbi:META domain-containing protein [Sphingobacterium paucimobilis]|nr:META domain-containing protein [Sphingobacterium paucimobilis]
MKLSFIKINRSFIVLATVISLGMSSCAIKKSGADKNMNAALFDTKWQLTELNGKPVPNEVNGKQPFMSFEKNENRYSASGGCNGIGGTFELKSTKKIKFSQGMSTMMACPDMSVEQGINQMLGKADNFELTGDLLILKQGTTPVAKMKASKATSASTELEGTWEMDYVLHTSESFQALYPERKPTITFTTAEHKVNGNSSCNNFFGDYKTSEGNRIKFGALGMTRMFCPGNGESVFVKNLEKVTRYSVSEGILTCISDDIVVMRFKKK